MIKWAIILIVAAGLAGGWYAYTEYNRKPQSMANASPDASLRSTELIAAFEKDETGSNKLYLDKVVEVNGILKESSIDDRGFITLLLGEENSMSSVRCSIDSLFTQEAASFRIGSLVKVKGVCSGFTSDELLGSDVTLIRCAMGTNNK